LLDFHLGILFQVRIAL
jgi:hypothetical protein